MITASKMTRFILLLSLGVSTAASSQTSPIQQVSNSGASKVQKVTIHGKRLSEEQKRIFDMEQRNKLTIDQLEKNPLIHAHENVSKAEASTSNNKLIKLSAKTT